MRLANIPLCLSFVACSAPAAMADVPPPSSQMSTPPEVAIIGIVLSLAAIALGLLINKLMSRGSKSHAKERVVSSDNSVAR